MRAAVVDSAGGPEVLKIQEVAVAVPKEGQGVDQGYGGGYESQ